MKIEQTSITVRDLVDGYSNNAEEGVSGYGGMLDIRPPYQREFVYKDAQRDAVITTILRGLPLNVMYWADIGNGRFEIIDGQQRTISICQYVHGGFSIKRKRDDSRDEVMFFHNLQRDEQKIILDYELSVYTCSGNDSERLEWFETINVAGEKLTPQELRNAVYHGSWVSDAKKYFSKKGCPAQDLAGDYLTGSAIRQEYLQTAIEWVNDGNVAEYMSIHQHDNTAFDIWNHFNSVISWVNSIFPKYRRQMKGINWGKLYKNHKHENLDPVALESEIEILLMDDDVTKKSGVYPYVLTRDEKWLSIRTFSPAMKVEVYGRQNGICPSCNDEFDIKEMEADHIEPWSQGGKTNVDNCQMLCKSCNRRKSDK